MIPATMQAIELQEYGASLSLVQRPVLAPGRNEVLVKMAAAPVNPSDLIGLDEPVDGSDLPLIPGREGSGVVVDAGSGFLAQWLKGKRVACSSPYGHDGTWAEYVVTSADFCIPLQKQVDMETGATMLVNPLSAWALVNTIRKRGHKAIANTAAASQIGRMILNLAQAQGMTVVNIVRRPEHIDLLKSRGAAHVLNSTDPDFNNQMPSLFRNLRVTLALDAIAGDMTGQLLDALPNHSEVLVYGRLSGRHSSIVAGTLILEYKTVSGFFLGRWITEQNLLSLLYASDQVQKRLGSTLKVEIRQRVRLEEFAAAIGIYKANMTAGKMLLVFQP